MSCLTPRTCSASAASRLVSKSSGATGWSLAIDAPVALVTGSTRGIGWSTARALARDGMTVVVSSGTSAEAAASRASELQESFGAEALGVACDVREPARVEELFREI